MDDNNDMAGVQALAFMLSVLVMVGVIASVARILSAVTDLRLSARVGIGIVVTSSLVGLTLWQVIYGLVLTGAIILLAVGVSIGGALRRHWRR